MAEGNTLLELFLTEKLSNLIKKLDELQIQNKKGGQILMDALGELLKEPSALLGYISEGLKPLCVKHEDGFYSFNKQYFEEDTLKRAANLSGILKLPLEECLFTDEINNTLFKYFDCFIDVVFNK